MAFNMNTRFCCSDLEIKGISLLRPTALFWTQTAGIICNLIWSYYKQWMEELMNIFVIVIYKVSCFLLPALGFIYIIETRPSFLTWYRFLCLLLINWPCLVKEFYNRGMYKYLRLRWWNDTTSYLDFVLANCSSATRFKFQPDSNISLNLALNFAQPCNLRTCQ